MDLGIDPTHHDYVMKVLKYEKWCFCEKPLSQNARDCEEISEISVSPTRHQEP